MKSTVEVSGQFWFRDLPAFAEACAYKARDAYEAIYIATAQFPSFDAVSQEVTR